MLCDSDMPSFVPASAYSSTSDLEDCRQEQLSSVDTQSGSLPFTECVQSTEADTHKYPSPPPPHFYQPGCTCEQCTKETAYEEASRRVEELGKQTRLHDHGFSNDKTLSVLHLPFKTQQKLLCQAYRLAQAACFHAERRFRADGDPVHFGHGPSSIRFEFSDRPRAWQVGIQESIFEPKAKQMVPFRNTISHPDSRSLGTLDKLLFYAQDFAVAVQDEGRATRLRLMRDDLQVEARREIERITLRLADFCKHDWAFHHQHLCQEIVRGMAWEARFMRGPFLNTEEKYGEFLADAARAWKMRYRCPGRERESYKSIVSSKGSYLRDAGRGRRASVSIFERPPKLPATPTQEQDDALLSRLAIEPHASKGEEFRGKREGVEALDLSVPLLTPISSDIFMQDSGKKEAYPTFKVRK